MAIQTYVKDNQELFKVRVKRFGVQKERHGIKTRSEAKRVEKDLERRILEEKRVRETSGEPLGILLNAWTESASQEAPFHSAQSQNSIDDTASVIELHAKHLLKRPILLIDRTDILEVLIGMQTSGLSYARVRFLISSLRKVLSWCEDRRRLRPKQTDYLLNDLLKRQRKPERKPEVLNQGEIETLLFKAKQAEHPWYPIWACALLTGCRNGELFALKWMDVDLEKKMITISTSWNRRLRAEKSTKSDKFRTISINDDLEQILNEMRPKTASSGYVLPRPRDWVKGEQAKVLRLFCESIGITSVRFHALRASFTTQLLARGVPVNKVQKLGGWSTLATLGIYNRLAGVDVKGATDSLKILPKDGTLIEFKPATEEVSFRRVELGGLKA